MFYVFIFFFFFQAEDGIRDKLVTGVQTCALPISSRCSPPRQHSSPVRVAYGPYARSRSNCVRLGWSGMALAMYSVGSGMVLAMGDLAGATFVTRLAATATQFARAGRLWTLCTIEIEVAERLGWWGMALAIDDPPWRRSCRRDAAAGGLRGVQSDSRDVRLERDRAGRFEEPGMCSVGSGLGPRGRPCSSTRTPRTVAKRQ